MIGFIGKYLWFLWDPDFRSFFVHGAHCGVRLAPERGARLEFRPDCWGLLFGRSAPRTFKLRVGPFVLTLGEIGDPCLDLKGFAAAA